MSKLLLESGAPWLLEDGARLLLEDEVTTGPEAWGYVTLRANMRAPYEVGDRVLFTASFFDRSDVATSVDDLTFTWRTPDGAESVYSYGTDAQITQDTAGVYLFAAPVFARHGRHQVRVASTGNLVAAAELNIGVRVSPFT